MRILIPSSSTFEDQYGGGQVYVRSVAEELTRHGHTVIVVSLHPDRSTDAGESMQTLDHGPILEERISFRDKPDSRTPTELTGAALQAAVNCLLRHQPDVVHANAWKTTFAAACHQHGTPCIVTAHHGGIVCPAGALLDWQDRICSRAIDQDTCAGCCRRKMPLGWLIDPLFRYLPLALIRPLDGVLCRIRNIPFLSPAVRMTTAPGRLRKSVGALSLPGTILVAPSRAIASALERNGIQQEQILHIPHGIQPYSRNLLQPLLGARAPRFLFIGRISPVKGLHVLLRALSTLPSGLPWELHIAGTDVTRAERRYKKSLIKSHPGAARIRWLGRLDRQQLGRAIDNCDLLVLPSICLEVFGLVILEAFSAGRPVVATRCGGPEEIVRHEVDGLLVAPNDVTDLAESLRRLIEHPEEIRRLASNVQPVTSIEQHVRALESAYAQALNVKPTPAQP
jgi:glycosyltransferase involved in cell wall biosynthesis